MREVLYERTFDTLLIGPSGLRALHGTKCPLLTAFFHPLEEIGNILQGWQSYLNVDGKEEHGIFSRPYRNIP